MGIWMDRVKKAVHAGREESGPGRFAAGARPITCPQCGHDQFETREAKLNTTVMTLVDLDWADTSATVLTCTRCSRLEWYLECPERI